MINFNGFNFFLLSQLLSTLRNMPKRREKCSGLIQIKKKKKITRISYQPLQTCQRKERKMFRFDSEKNKIKLSENLLIGVVCMPGTSTVSILFTLWKKISYC